VGTLIAALTAEGYTELSAGITGETRMLTPPETLALEPLLRSDIAGGLWAPGDAMVDNRLVGLALAFAFVGAGGTLNINEAVVRLEVAGNAIAGARTPFALHTADAYVIAAGAWSGEIAGLPPEAIPATLPVKGEMIALLPPGGQALPSRLVWGNSVYLIPRRDRLFIGATVSKEGFDTSTTDAARLFLHSHACALMPDLAKWEIVEQWAGLRPGTPDGLPLIGETAIPGLFVASGQFRNGVLFAPAIAKAICDLVAGQKRLPELEAFRPGRFGPAHLAGGHAVG
jgi:glycine oxidase